MRWTSLLAFVVALLGCSLYAQSKATLVLTAHSDGQPWTKQTLVTVWFDSTRGVDAFRADLAVKAESDANGIARFEGLLAGSAWVMTQAEYDAWEEDSAAEPVRRPVALKDGENKFTVEFDVAGCAWLDVSMQLEPKATSVQAFLKPTGVCAGYRSRIQPAAASGATVIRFGLVPTGTWRLEIVQSIGDVASWQGKLPLIKDIDVKEGAPQSIEVSMKTFALAGKVTPPKGARSKGCVVNLLPGDLAWPWTSSSSRWLAPVSNKETDKFDFGELPAGEYVVCARSVTKTGTVYACERVSLTKQQNDLKISFSSKVGEVVVTTALPLAPEVFNVRLLGGDGKPAAAFAELKWSTDARKSSELVFYGVAPGDYTVEACGYKWVTASAEVKVKDGQRTACELKLSTSTPLEVRGDDGTCALDQLTCIFEDKAGLPIAYSVRPEAATDPVRARDKMSIPFTPAGSARVRFVIPGYEDELVNISAGEARQYVNLKLTRKK